MFSENEIKSAILKKYFELKNKSGLKLIYRLTAIIIFFVDALIFLSITVSYITNQNLQLVISFAVLLLTFGFIFSFQLILRKLLLVNEIRSDRYSTKISGNPEDMKSYISKSSENYMFSPLAIGRRYERAMTYQKKQAERRIRNINQFDVLRDH